MQKLNRNSRIINKYRRICDREGIATSRFTGEEKSDRSSRRTEREKAEERQKRRKEQEREEREKERREQEERKRRKVNERKKRSKMMQAKTKRGQVNLNNHMRVLLQKIKKQESA